VNLEFTFLLIYKSGVIDTQKAHVRYTYKQE